MNARYERLKRKVGYALLQTRGTDMIAWNYIDVQPECQAKMPLPCAAAQLTVTPGAIKYLGFSYVLTVQ